MPRYRFRWENLSPALLTAICDSLGLSGENRVDTLRGSFGARPNPEFVRDAWPVLRDHWLDEDAASREAVLGKLRKARLGSPDAAVGTQEEQMVYLHCWHNQQSLREIVLAQLLAVGESSTTPTTAHDTRLNGSPPIRRPSAGDASARATADSSGQDVDWPWTT
jgi:hypothetical protein